MGSATARIFTLISTSTGTPLLHRHSSSSLRLLRRLATLSSPLILPPPLSNFHTRSHSAADSTAFPATALASVPWPEWSHFVDRISGPGVRNARHLDDDGEFAAPSQLSDAFLNDAAALLAFARRNPSLLGFLPREDIEVIIEYVSPSLFKDAAIVTSRMRSFLAGDANYVSEYEKPCTVDLMKFLLSYAHMVIISSEEVDNSGKVESSVRKLFSDLAKSNGASAESVASVQTQFLEGYGPRSRSFGNNIAMKKGDWICTRCSFMNFAKNQSCLQCEEARPKKILIGGEWDCPQCDFLNFSRNVVCLRCDCKKPGGNPQQSSSGVSGFGSNRSSGISNTVKPIAEREGQQQQWLTKITQLEESSDLSNSVADEDFSKFKPAGGSGAASQSRNLAVDGNLDGVDIKARSGNNNINMHINQALDELLGHRSPTSDSSGNDGAPGKSIKGESLSATSNAASPEYGNLSDPKSSRDAFASANAQLSVEKCGSQMGDKDREQAEKSERWFKKVSEANDVQELSSSISDEDFPEIMPMRTGENRFVVSKKKDRSLTSPMYKRRTTMEQAGSSNHVPFVPFPPGYFTQEKPDSTSPSSKLKASGDAKTDIRNDSNYAKLPGEQTGGVSSDPGRTGVRNADKTRDSNETSQKTDETESFDPQFRSSRSDGYSKSENGSGTDLYGATQERENSSPTDISWRGRSLEGSAVKEPDPLDMSEEAKTERWFRRVAQIKDISELSQIPDEDFPSIMPMRKGVNRFVVSKRKTPLERRLTSSQYRRNLPVVNSEPHEDRKETESS